MKYNTFVFESFSFQNETGTLLLRYRFSDGPGFEEKIVFSPPQHKLSQDEQAALNIALRLIFILCGVSYYKAYVPEKLFCQAFPLDTETARFAEKVYRKGLAEFAYRNKIDLENKINFTAENLAAPKAIPLKLPRRSLVPVGGGKDSIVTLECLKQSGELLTLFAMGPGSGLAAPIKATIETSGLPFLQIKRTLSANLMELNRQGALNGHVPITAIMSIIAVACAIMHGFDAVVMSNEHSASEPNLYVNGQEINHQYSKSMEFEKDFAQFVHNHITPSLDYFSFLRPLTETAIVRRFASMKKYHNVFRSCNSAFRQDSEKQEKNWCGDCPKCRFIFLALAPFMDKVSLVKIFGRNLLADTAQQEGFMELCGLSAHKPFECVGEIEESALLMQKLTRNDEWKNDTIVVALKEKLPLLDNFEERFAALFKMKNGHSVPDRFMEILCACT